MTYFRPVCRYIPFFGHSAVELPSKVPFIQCVPTYGNDNWNRFEIRDRFGNRWIYIDAKDILSADELETMKSVVSNYNLIEFIEQTYDDSKTIEKDLNISGAEEKMQQLSLFGKNETAGNFYSDKSDEIITAVLMRGSGFENGKFRF